MELTVLLPAVVAGGHALAAWLAAAPDPGQALVDEARKQVGTLFTLFQVAAPVVVLGHVVHEVQEGRAAHPKAMIGLAILGAGAVDVAIQMARGIAA